MGIIFKGDTMNKFHKNLGKKIRIIREAKGISQEELAEKSQLSTNQIGRIERAERSPSLKSLLKLCDGLGISIQELFEGLPGRQKDAGKEEVMQKLIALFENRDEKELRLFYKIASDIADFHK